MLDVGWIALATLFATVGPVDISLMFAALTANLPEAQRRSIALRGTLIALGILLSFALIGDHVLTSLGISLAALRTAGGILLLLIGIDMVFGRSSGATSTTVSEQQEASTRPDIAVFPLATPLLAGPGAMGAVVLLMANAQQDVWAQSAVLVSIVVIMLISYGCLRIAARLQSWLGITGSQVIRRVLGVLLCALAVQFVFDGIVQSGVLSS